MTTREGSLEAPTRHPVEWKSPDYLDEPKIVAEMERVFDICHGCRRCVSLCNAFPKLFDFVDESESMEVDGVPKEKWKDGEFLSPHCADWDAKGDLYVLDWNAHGRVSKLERVR